MGEITHLLEKIRDGDPGAGDALISLTYDELRKIAAHLMARERSDHTLQKTALVNEAFIRVADKDGKLGPFNNRGHFFTALGEAMRRILVENARRRNALKRGAGANHTQWDDSKLVVEMTDERILEVNDALLKLEEEDPMLAKIVNLKFFFGMTITEIADGLETSKRTVDRQWECAKAWLYRCMKESE